MTGSDIVNDDILLLLYPIILTFIHMYPQNRSNLGPKKDPEEGQTYPGHPGHHTPVIFPPHWMRPI